MSGASENGRPRSFSFGPFLLVPERQLLLHADAPVRIGGRALDLLTALVERPGEDVSKQELISRVWPRTVVEDCNLKVHMAALRRALGDEPGIARYVATVTGRGYRFVAPVKEGGLPGARLPSVATAKPRHNLPFPRSRIFGRADAIEAIRRDLEVSRLVTVLGPGGIGKTTVALAVAEKAIGHFRDGVWLVDFSLLNDASLTPNAIAMAVGMPAHAADMRGALCEFLREREMLLVLDSCEHMLDAVAGCIDQILAHAAGVKILVTSRAPLELDEERLRRLPGLGTPSSTAQLGAQEALAFPAVQLFVDRATDRLESFELRDAEAPAVAEICSRLDGLALAIEFAATRIDAFGVGGLLKQLDDRFHVIVGRRAGPQRHRTLAATLDWSYGLLPAREAALLRAVSVFAGVFDMDGAVAVSGLRPTEVAGALAELVAKSLLAVDVDGADVAYRLLETTRAYGLDKLADGGKNHETRLRHAEHVCRVLDRATVEWSQGGAVEWACVYGRYLDDLRAALTWARRETGNGALRIRLTVAGLLVWNHFSHTEECRARVSEAVAELDAAGLAGSAFEMQLKAWLGGATMFTQGLMSQAMDAMERALDIANERGDLDYRVRCLRLMGVHLLFCGENDAAIRTIGRLTAIATTEMPSAIPEAEAALGFAELFTGQFRSVRQRLERRRALDLGDISDARRPRHHVRYLSDRVVNVGNVLSHVLWLTGSPDSALRMTNETVAYAQQTGHHLSLGNALSWAVLVFYWTGRHEECARCATQLDDLASRHGFAVRRPTAMFYRAALACERSGASPSDVDALAEAVMEFHATGNLARLPFYLGVLADFSARSGRLGEAELTINAALDRAAAKNEQWCMPELVRIRASVLAARGRAEEAESQLLESISLAEAAGAAAWRLRAATDLARLLGGRLQVREACRVLVPALHAFTEGRETRDLVDAAQIHAALADREAALSP